MAHPTCYQTTLDRAGLALATGGVLTGLAATTLALVGGERHPVSLALTLIGGSVLGALGITAVALPIWAICHATGRRSPSHAAAVAALACLAVCTVAQTAAPVPLQEMGERTLAFRWFSILASSLTVAGAAALVGLAMWRIAYRHGDARSQSGPIQ